MCMYKYGNDIIFIIHSGIKGLIATKSLMNGEDENIRIYF